MELLNISEEEFLKVFDQNSVGDTAKIFNTTKSNIELYIKAKNIPPHTRKWVGNQANRRHKIDIPKDKLEELFINNNMTRKDVAEYFKCSEALIKKKCREYGIKKEYSQFKQNINETLMDRYGTTRVDIIGKDKTEQTNMEKYGAKTPFESSVVQAKVSDNKRKSTPSTQEFRVMLVLDKFGIPYSREVFYKIPDVMTFDFVIFNGVKFGFIEADGIYHSKNIVDDDRIKRSVKRDTLKTEFCSNNNIPMLRISYQESDTDIENKINKFYTKLL